MSEPPTFASSRSWRSGPAARPSRRTSGSGSRRWLLVGFGNGGAVVANITLVQRGAPDRVRGRAFTVVMSVNYAFLGLAFIVAGPLTNAYGARWAYAVASGTVVIAAAVAMRFTRGIELDLAPAPQTSA